MECCDDCPIHLDSVTEGSDCDNSVLSTHLDTPEQPFTQTGSLGIRQNDSFMVSCSKRIIFGFSRSHWIQTGLTNNITAQGLPCGHAELYNIQQRNEKFIRKVQPTHFIKCRLYSSINLLVDRCKEPK